MNTLMYNSTLLVMELLSTKLTRIQPLYGVITLKYNSATFPLK